MAKELTTITLEKIKPGPARREIPDGRIGGLYFIVQPSGKLSWAFRYRAAGKPRKYTIGQYPSVSLKTARERAGEARDKVAEGVDPGAEKKASRAAALIPAIDLAEAVVKQFVSHYAKRQLKASTAREVERILVREIVQPWRGRRLSQISRSDIHVLLDDIVARGSPVTGNRTLAWLRRMCSWAIERGLIIANPFAGIKPPAAETARDRVLSDDELRAVWEAADALEPVYAGFIKLLILTGQRLREVSELEWKEIDLDAKLWTLPGVRAKNSIEHVIPLSDQAVDILKALPRIAGSDFVFTINGRNPIRGIHQVKRRIDKLAPPMPPWVLHDIRRTGASGMARLGINLPVIEKLLNHVSGSFAGIVGVYQRHSFSDEKRVAMQAWARHLEAIVSGETAANVVDFAKARV
jgi:integrase